MGELMNPKEVEERTSAALDRFLHEDEYLLRYNLGERTIAHRFAVCLEAVFPEWNVDCEYNRDGRNIKRIPLSEACRRLFRTTDAVNPDIIVHIRGGRNLLAVEIKKAGIPGRECDIQKLHGYMEVLGYAYGLFLCFRTGNRTEWVKERKLYVSAASQQQHAPDHTHESSQVPAAGPHGG